MPASQHSPEVIEASPPRELVMQELESILASALFRTSRQCQRFLRYIVERTLDGHGDALRERVIGMAVFDRPADYDPGQDPVVRIRAADVRKRLAQYYQANGAAPPIVIDVPSGSYRATFRVHTPAAETSGSALAETGATAIEAVPVLPAEQLPARRKWSNATAAVVLGLFALLVAAMLAPRWSHRGGPKEATGFDQFWAPFFTSTQPVLLCLGSNAVYTLSDSYMKTYRLAHGIPADGAETYVDLSPKSEIPANALVPVPNTFVGDADVVAASDVVAMLAGRSRNYAERFSGDLTFAELRHTPAVLVGGFNNRWTLEMTGDLRYRMADGHSIIDTETKQMWSTAGARPEHPTDDYALISRLQDAKTGAPLLVIAGVGAYGTQAAGEFVSSRSALAAFARSAPAGWAQKNMQIVLHVRVVEFAPSTTDVVAEQSW